ncbi:MAG TPA: TM0106 family RecB-like putative nuclease [Candidatus Limnocylindrales bacterium]|nr:TM0106 family RecB-like putative nuclease [Candidatus Limnocylindrales bacterium]
MQLIDGRPVYAATDLVGFLACSHRFALERAALAGLVKKPIRNDPTIETVAKRGHAHEQRYLADLKAAGKAVVEVPGPEDDDERPRGERLRAQAAATEAAMRSGADVIYQATFFDGTWLGFADFLLRVETPSDLGAWSYEVADTKLARSAKASAILQVCSYVEQLHRVQGVEPKQLHLVLGGSARETKSFPVSDFMAYYRTVKAGFEAAMAAGQPVYPVTATYPEPVEHCDVCNWAVDCKAQRRRDDDLSLVAGITSKQRKALKSRGTKTRRELAVLQIAPPDRLDGVSRESFDRIHDQAAIQVRGEDAKQPLKEFIEPEFDKDGNFVPDRGFLVLPEPSPNDLFFDIEGDPFALDDGVEYLFGVLEPGRPDPRRPGEPMFHEIWSRDGDARGGDVTRAAEKSAFEELVDLLINRLDADPSMHVYHYAAYEKTALGRLAQRHATREEEVDRLLRGRVLVDLYRVVKQGLIASVESYSIKRLEGLYEFVREQDLKSAGSSIVAFEAWLDGGAAENGDVGEAILHQIAEYNRDDVLSNWKLRDWLERCRLELAAELGREIPRPAIEPNAEKAQELTDEQRLVADLVRRLTTGLPADADSWSETEHARWLLAQLLDFHRREDKAFWWRFFELAQKTDEELVDERETLGKLQFVADLGPWKHSILEQYSFPIQDHALKEGRPVVNPETVKEFFTRSVGTVHEIDELNLTVTLRRSKEQQQLPRPQALIPVDTIGTDELRAALQRIARWVIDYGVDGGRDAFRADYRAARDLLLRRPPRGVGAGPLRLPGSDETPKDAAVRLGKLLDHGTLAIQGPPGSGKTFTAAHMIVALVKSGKRVGVTANSHKVIGNALNAIDKAARKQKVNVRIGQRHANDEKPTSPIARPLATNAEAREALMTREVDVVGGTAWLWSRADMEGTIDVLFVDEAGQFSLASALAVSTAASSLVLLGDPQQLEQPLQGSHPPGAERSALGHVLGTEPVIDPANGLFLEDTWRLHPDIAAYTSEVFYAGQLGYDRSVEGNALAGIAPATGTGVRWAPVVHGGDPRESIEEATFIASLIRELVDGGATYTDSEVTDAPITPDKIVVVAPYNAHVERIQETLDQAGLPTDRVGTVDKFQGQEAPISIYSMATPTPEEAPRGMEFLYSLNRLNVATSRAKCVAIVVASPDLIRVTCHTPRQMQLANALCRFVEVAEGRGPAPAGLGPTRAAPAREEPPLPPAPGPEAELTAAGPTTGDQLSWLG